MLGIVLTPLNITMATHEIGIIKILGNWWTIGEGFAFSSDKTVSQKKNLTPGPIHSASISGYLATSLPLPAPRSCTVDFGAGLGRSCLLDLGSENLKERADHSLTLQTARLPLQCALYRGVAKKAMIQGRWNSEKHD